MFVVWALIPVLVAWAVIGILIGIAAARRRRVFVYEGIFGGMVLGPLAFFIMFGESPSRYARRCCSVCTNPNDFLTYHSSSLSSDRNWGDFVAPQPKFMHHYRCRACGYDYQFESWGNDPDNPDLLELRRDLTEGAVPHRQDS